MCRRMRSMILKMTSLENLEAALVEMVLMMPWWLDRSLVHSAARKLKTLKASGRPVPYIHNLKMLQQRGGGEPESRPPRGAKPGVTMLMRSTMMMMIMRMIRRSWMTMRPCGQRHREPGRVTRRGPRRGRRLQHSTYKDTALATLQ